jgi:nucleoside-diphosphate-sugar epimerase
MIISPNGATRNSEFVPIFISIIADQPCKLPFIWSNCYNREMFICEMLLRSERGLPYVIVRPAFLAVTRWDFLCSTRSRFVIAVQVSGELYKRAEEKAIEGAIEVMS